MAKNIFQKLYHSDLKKVYKKFDGIIIDNLIGDIPDLQDYFERLKKELKESDRILISYHNPTWEPVLTLASNLGLRKKVGTQNWIDRDDLSYILRLSGFEVISSQLRFFGITSITIAKPIKAAPTTVRKYKVSIIVPARNEEKNISKIVPSIPKFGKWQEIIFVEGGSTDNTWQKIEKEKAKRKNVTAIRQKGIGKANAVWQGFEIAKGDILIIYDADRTVNPKDLIKFYNALAGEVGEFANGSRLIYPMEGEAMQTLNKIGNILFSRIFTWIFGQRFKDTLCGTKALFRKDYISFKKYNKKYFRVDPFGDFTLIFGAVRHSLKVVEIPVRYRARESGRTNISRFRHGIMLAKMTLTAFKEFRA